MTLSSTIACTDIGGHQTSNGRAMRTGLLYRISGALVDSGDLVTLASLGLRTIIDMRAVDEDRHLLLYFAEEAGIDYHHAPIHLARLDDFVADPSIVSSISQGRSFMRETYRSIVDQQAPALAAAINALDGGLPAGFGCAAGKDRTGILAALIQLILGVPEDVVVSEYVRCAPDTRRLLQLAKDRFPPGSIAGQGIEYVLSADPDTLTTVLAHIDRAYGGVDRYLEEAGLKNPVLVRLKDALLEPATDGRIEQVASRQHRKRHS